jgi:hypothetical protein
VLSAAFDEIAACGMSYQLRQSDAGGFLFRYTKNDDVGGAIAKRPEYGLYNPKTAPANWTPPGHRADTCAELGRKSNSFEMEIPVFRHKSGKTTMTKKKDLLSNHSWGTAIDLNYSTNDFSSRKPFDMPPIIVEILINHGFYWAATTTTCTSSSCSRRRRARAIRCPRPMSSFRSARGASPSRPRSISS